MKIDTNKPEDIERILSEIQEFVPVDLIPVFHKHVEGAGCWVSNWKSGDEALLHTFVGMCCVIAARFPNATEPAENAAVRILLSLKGDEEATNE